MKNVSNNNESKEKRYKVLLFVYEDECFVDISCAKDLRSKFQVHKAGKKYETASWKEKAKCGGKFAVYLLEETENPITCNSTNNLLFAWILYYKHNENYVVCNTELDAIGSDYPVDTLRHYKRICTQIIKPTFIRNVEFEKKRHGPYTVRETDKDADIKQMNIRVTSDTKERFKAFCNNNGVSPTKAFEFLLDLADNSSDGLLEVIASQEAMIQEGKEKQRLTDNAEEQIIDSFRNGLIPRLKLRQRREKEFISLYNEYFLKKYGKPKLRVERFKPYVDVNKYQYPDAEYGYTVLKIQGMEWGRQRNLINVFGIDEQGNHLRFRYCSGMCYLGVTLWNAFINNDCDVFFIAYEKGNENGSFIVGILPIGAILCQRKFKDEDELERQLFLSDVVDLIQGVDDYANPDCPQDGIRDGDEMLWLNPRFYKKIKANNGIIENDDFSYSLDDVALLYFDSHKDEKAESRFSKFNYYIDDDMQLVLKQLKELDELWSEDDDFEESKEFDGEEQDDDLQEKTESDSTLEQPDTRAPNLDDVIKGAEKQGNKSQGKW